MWKRIFDFNIPIDKSAYKIHLYICFTFVVRCCCTKNDKFACNKRNQHGIPNIRHTPFGAFLWQKTRCTPFNNNKPKKKEKWLENVCVVWFKCSLLYGISRSISLSLIFRGSSISTITLQLLGFDIAIQLMNRSELCAHQLHNDWYIRPMQCDVNVHLSTFTWKSVKFVNAIA